MIAALIFDFDGTILDTETPEYEVWRTTFERHGARLDLHDWGRGVGTWDAFDPHTHLETLTGQRFDRHDLHQRVRTNVLDMIHTADPIPGALEVLSFARARGLRLAVASSSDRAWVEGHLSRLGLLAFFESLSTRYDVERVKPDPALYQHALARLGLEADQAIAIEDSPNGAKAALAAGLRTIAVPNPVTDRLEFPSGVFRVAQLSVPMLEKYLSQHTG